MNNEEICMSKTISLDEAQANLTDIPRRRTSHRCILNLRLLYPRYLLKYCSPQYLDTPGYLISPLSMDYLCFNFWDRSSLFPTSKLGNRAIHAGLDVMESALALPNDNLILSAVEALCSWTYACSYQGIDRPTSQGRDHGYLWL